MGTKQNLGQCGWWLAVAAAAISILWYAAPTPAAADTVVIAGTYTVGANDKDVTATINNLAQTPIDFPFQDVPVGTTSLTVYNFDDSSYFNGTLPIATLTFKAFTQNVIAVTNGYAAPTPAPSPIPIPSTWTMMVLGLAVLGFVAYRGQKLDAARTV